MSAGGRVKQGCGVAADAKKGAAARRAEHTGEAENAGEAEDSGKAEDAGAVEDAGKVMEPGAAPAALRVLSGLVIAMALASLGLQVRELAQGQARWTTVAAAVGLHFAFIVAHLLPYRLSSPSPLRHVVVAAATAALLALAVLPGSQYLTFFLFLAVVSQAQLVLPPAAGIRAAVATSGLALMALAWVTPAWVSPDSFWLNAVSLTMGLVFSAAVSYLARSQMRLSLELRQANDNLRRSHQQLEQAHRQLQAYAAQAEELAAMRERNRLAQELHDTLAHTLTGLIMQLEVAASLMQAGELAAEGALAAVRRALAGARQGLAEARRAVHALYPELLQGLSPSESLRRLAQQFAGQTGIAVAFREAGEPAALPAPVQVVLFRALQEMLTNAGRHSQARRIDILLEWSAADVRLSAYDDGRGAADFSPGFGLLSMQQRAASCGGTVRFDNRPGEGFGVTMTIPLRRATVAT